MGASDREQREEKPFCTKCFVTQIIGLLMILGIAGGFLLHIALDGTFGGLLP